jgi:hypothetical protein
MTTPGKAHDDRVKGGRIGFIMLMNDRLNIFQISIIL